MKLFRQIMAFVLKNISLSKRYLGWEIVFLFYHIVGALAIGYLAKSMEGDYNNLLIFLLVGSVMWVYLSSIFHEIGNQIAFERWEGTIEYTFMAPVKRIVHLTGNSIFAIIYAIAKMTIVMVVAALIFGIDMSNANIGSALVILCVSAFSFIGLGMIASIIPLMSPEKGSQALHIVEALLMLVSGIYYEITVLPLWMQKISVVSPATYAMDGMRDALINGVNVSSMLLTHIIPLAIMGIIFIPLGNFVFGLAETHAKKKGNLKRQG